MKEKVFLQRYNSKKNGWLHDVLWFIVILVVVFVVFNFIIGVSVVSGSSMEPTLNDGQKVVYLKVNKSPKVGDLISIWVPSGDYYVKRVVAEGGDVVDLYDGRLYVNGVQLDFDGVTDETWPDEESALVYPYEVREGNYFVLGDNRDNSTDSRLFGEVSRKQIHGVIFWK